MITWELVEPGPDDPNALSWEEPEPWKGPKGQGKCPVCGRFVTRGGTCSLYLPVYRSGSPAGYEHR